MCVGGEQTRKAGGKYQRKIGKIYNAKKAIDRWKNINLISGKKGEMA